MFVPVFSAKLNYYKCTFHFQTGRSCIFIAAERGRTEGIKILIEAGADVHIVDIVSGVVAIDVFYDMHICHNFAT